MTSAVDRARLYWETVRHLRPVQLYGRLWFRLARPTVDDSPPPALRRPGGAWVHPARRRPSLLGEAEVRFLNETRSLDAGGWEDSGATKLWLYNLHYFDDLNAAGADARRGWHQSLISRWLAEVTPGRGTGWEPYPTSLRIVNWIKFARGGEPLPIGTVHSLAVQTRWLDRRLEHHLLGNHLFANAKALVFAGCFFEGGEAQAWLRRGLDILAREIPEQILPDGGQFELSTMYHALAVEDLLDLVNILRSAGQRVPASWLDRISAMRSWLAAMRHPDGEIAFFNDAAIGISPSPDELEAYAERLALMPLRLVRRPAILLADSGYIRLEAGPALALLDVARVGPDYLPGHAHADSLSFELSIGARRVIVNSGTSVYGANPERHRQRGTGAHNTVVIDGADSSEVWSGFRVARRARPKGLEILEGESVTVSCAHDGYRRAPGSPEHRRSWTFNARALSVEDRVTGPHGRAEALFHFHPDFELSVTDDGRGTAHAPDGSSLGWSIPRGRARIETSTWHPEFGRTEPSQRLAVELMNGEGRVDFWWPAS